MSFEKEVAGMLAGENPTIEDGWNEDTGEPHTPWRREPGSSSKWELDQSLVYGNSKAPGPANKPDLDAISAQAAEAVSGLLDDMAVTEADFEQAQSAEEIDANVLNKASEFSGPRNRDAQFPGLFPKQQAPGPGDGHWDDEPEYETVYQPVEPVEVAEQETETPFDFWGAPAGANATTAGDVEARMEALDELEAERAAEAD